MIKIFVLACLNKVDETSKGEGNLEVLVVKLIKVHYKQIVTKKL